MTPEVANTMVSNYFEIFHVSDIVDQSSTTYHYHDFYEIHCTLQGTATFFADEHRFQLSPGTIVLIPPNTLHRILNQTSENYERIYIFVSPNFLKKISTTQTNLEACFQSVGNTSGFRHRVILTDPKELAAALQPFDRQPEKSYGSDIEYQLQFLDFMLKINRAALSQEDEFALVHERLFPNKQKEQLVFQVTNYINEHLDEDLTLQKMADVFFVDPSYLSRKFKKQTGISFHKYVLTKRLLFSKELLRDYRSATEVYSQCGFRSYTHFLRCFKNEFAMTPKEFLQQEAAPRYIRFEHFEAKKD